MATRWLCAFSRARCHWIAAAIHVALPSGGCPGEPIWAADGKRFAFVNIASESVELWIGDAKTGEVQGPVSTRTSPLRQRYGRCRLAR
jgi:hypothetical protein